MKKLSRNEYHIAIICALPLERTAVEAMLDARHEALPNEPGDSNNYSFGCIGPHNVVIASLAKGIYGIASASGVSKDLRRTFRSIKYAFMVGIAGGIPRPHEKGGDVRLGDIVVGAAQGVPSVINYRLGKQTKTTEAFDIRSQLAGPPESVLSAISALETQHKLNGPTYLRHLGQMLSDPRLNNPRQPADFYNMPSQPDRLYEAGFVTADPSDGTRPVSDQGVVERPMRDLALPPPEVCEPTLPKFVKVGSNSSYDYPQVHYGTIASADTVMKNAKERDAVYSQIKQQYKAEALCFEMEAAGIVKDLPSLVVRGICDYSDAQKNDDWHNFAAATAASYTKDLLMRISPEETIEIDVAKPSMQGNVHWIVPRKARGQYSGYSHVLQHLEQRIIRNGTDSSTSGNIVFVLSGMGGIGKTEAIFQFLSRNRESFWGIFWVDCGSESTALMGFKAIADVCSLSTQNTDNVMGNTSQHNAVNNVNESGVIDKVKRYLAQLTHPTLLVLDNCDSDKFDYREYMPSGGNTNVIMTTRLTASRDYATADPDNGNSVDWQRLQGLDPASALELVSMTSAAVPHVHQKQDKATEAATKLARVLGYHPLSIIVASALVRDGVYSLEEIATELQTQHGLAVADLLDEESEQARYRKISKTFEVSVESLRSASSKGPEKDALALLDVLAFFDREDVSEDIFTRAWAYEAEVLKNEGQALEISRLSPWIVTKCHGFLDDSSLERRRRRFRQGRRCLARRSLVELSEGGSSEQMDNTVISMHPMLHSWARHRIDEQHRDEAWTVAASILTLSIEEKIEWNWPEFSYRLGRHLEICFLQSPICGDVEEDSRHEVWRILYSFAWYAHRSESAMALEMAQKVTSYAEVLTKNAPEYAEYRYRSQYLVARCCFAANLVDKAGEILENLRAEVPPELLPDVLSLLGTAYATRGRYEEAQELREAVLQARKDLPADDFKLITAQYELASTQIENGQNEEALELIKHVSAAIPQDNPVHFLAQLDIADLYRESGLVEEMRKLVAEMTEVFNEMPLPLGHKYRLYLETRLVSVQIRDATLDADRKLELLETLFEELKKSALDAADEMRLLPQVWLGKIKERSGDVEEAREVFEKVIKIVADACLPMETYCGLCAKQSLAKIFYKMDRGEEAEKLLLGIIQTKDKPYIGATFDFVEVMQELGELYMDDDDRLQEAQDWLEKVVESKPKNVENGVAQLELGRVYRDRRYEDKARACYETLVKAGEEELPVDDPGRMEVEDELCNLYREFGRYGDAQELLKRIVDQRKIALAGDSEALRTAQASLAQVYVKQGYRQQARDMYEELLDVEPEDMLEVKGEELVDVPAKELPLDISVLKWTSELACLHDEMGDHEEAYRLIEKVTAGWERYKEVDSEVAETELSRIQVNASSRRFEMLKIDDKEEGTHDDENANEV